MTNTSGHVGLDWSVEAIQVGYRHRKDLGDLTELCASIQKLGLLQPVTISPHGTLLCGARRLAAVKHLGWKTVKVWVRSGISSKMEMLLAEQHENTLREPLSPIEAAEVYRELKTVMAEDAARRQQATRFGAEADEPAGQSGGVAATPPADGKTREQAAIVVTGQKSQNRLEQVGEIQELAEDDNAPDNLRAMAEEALAAIEHEGEVKGPYAAVRAAQALDQLVKVAEDPDRPASLRRQAAREAERLRDRDEVPATELLRLTKDALTRANAANPTQAEKRASRGGRKRGVRAFMLMWTELRGWTKEYDPVEIGRGLTDEQWADVEAVIGATITFVDTARRAREAADPQAV